MFRSEDLLHPTFWTVGRVKNGREVQDVGGQGIPLESSVETLEIFRHLTSDFVQSGKPLQGYNSVVPPWAPTIDLT